MPVMVNHKEITDEAIYQEMQYHPAGSADLAMEEAARALVIRELLLQKAEYLNIQCEETTDQPKEEALMDALIATVIQLPEPDAEVIDRFYQNNGHRFPKVDGQTPPLKDVQEAISDYLVETSWTNALRDFIRSLVQEATLSGVEFVLQ